MSEPPRFIEQLMGKKMSSLQGSMFSAPDIEYEKQVFESYSTFVQRFRSGLQQESFFS